MAKNKTVSLAVTGVCAIYVDGNRYMPDQIIEVEESRVYESAFEYLIARGDLTIQDNAAANKEVKERVNSRRKKDPLDGKSKKELEDGGEY